MHTLTTSAAIIPSIAPMTTREQLHRLVDELSEREADDALRHLMSRHKDPLLRAIAAAPEDDEPWTDRDEAAVRESRREYERGETVPLAVTGQHRS
jgi:hypothetical protein